MKHARKIIPAPVDAGFCSACDEAYEGTHCEYCFDDPWDAEDAPYDWVSHHMMVAAMSKGVGR